MMIAKAMTASKIGSVIYLSPCWVSMMPWLPDKSSRDKWAEEMQTFELFSTRKDARETQKVFEFGESCRPVPVEIKILA